MDHVVRLASPLFESFHDLTAWVNGLVDNPISHPEYSGYLVKEVLQVRAVRTHDTMYEATVFLSMRPPDWISDVQTNPQQSRTDDTAWGRGAFRHIAQHLSNRLQQLVRRGVWQPQLVARFEILPVRWWVSRAHHAIESTFSRRVQRIAVQKVWSRD